MMNSSFSPEIYEKLIEYTPWGKTLKHIVNVVLNNNKTGIRILDLMCGNGYILRRLLCESSDAVCVGIDASVENIKYINKKSSKILLENVDVLDYDTENTFDFVICSGGIHHISDREKINVLKKIKKFIGISGVALIADPFISDYDNEYERKIASAKLGIEYLKYAIGTNSSEDVLNECMNIMKQDILYYEYKTSVKKFLPNLHSVFSSVSQEYVWRTQADVSGDVLFICS